MSLAIIVLIFKGSSEGQRSVLGNLLTSYVEETAASVITIPSQNQLADINSLAAYAGTERMPKPSVLNTIQDNSLVSRGTILTDILDEFLDRGSQIAIYTVQEGDTLSFIASDYGVSINTIIWANNLSDADAIRPGMDLKIPPVTGVIHKVKKGDTVASLAKKYGVKEEEIVSFNGLPLSGDLQTDEEIIIPGGKINTPKAPLQQSTAPRFAYLPTLAGYFIQPATGYNWGRIHGRNGVDVANSCGTPIYAAANGRVTISDAVGYNGGFGKFIKVNHPNGTETLYAHASRLLANVGDFVARGQQIAVMGSTGRSTGCHVHFEVHGAKNPLAKY
ncbi:MAG: peptidoglycan DD-metalloendopeptidase family protein [Candidatus Yanofskybacteria bacterium]|nr:peptidoglycan DD-metalloendopeptidase family protein [Candidatus Yanofskybacteria bacterium]